MRISAANRTLPRPRVTQPIRQLHIRPRQHPIHHKTRIIRQSHASDQELDSDSMDAMQQACQQLRAAIESGDPKKIEALDEDFSSAWIYFMEVKDVESANFIAVLQGLLQHRVIESVSDLHQTYLRAYKLVYNALKSIGWELVRDRPADRSKSQSQWKMNQGGTNEEINYYQILDISPTADKIEIKNAYRALALQWHPDVSQEENASEKFIKISKAYDVLSNSQSRKLYDMYGADGMEDKAGSHAGDGNADRYWSEFKPFKKERRRSKARSAAMSRASDADADESEPQPGDVVEYPLSDVIKEELQDGREKGVGLLVGRNKDRGDVDSLPDDLRGVCEIEPLRQQERDSCKWIPDELGCSAFCDLAVLTRVPVTSYDERFDIWVIETTLSDGCGGPEIVEETVL